MSGKKESYTQYLFYDFMKWFCFWPVALYLRPKHIYRSEKAKSAIKGPGILAYNHNSFMDVLYVQLGIWKRRHRIVSEREQLGHGKNRIFLKMLLSIPIDRDSVSPATVRAIVNPLKNGHLVDIFPEGVLNRQPYMLLPFKKGVSLFSYLGSAPLIPVYIDRGAHFWNRLTFVVGEPVFPADWEAYYESGRASDYKEALPLVTECLEERMKELASYAESRRKK